MDPFDPHAPFARFGGPLDIDGRDPVLVRKTTPEVALRRARLQQVVVRVVAALLVLCAVAGVRAVVEACSSDTPAASTPHR